MKPVRNVVGSMLPLDREDVDTDQIMPKQFLKRVGRDGFGEFLFHDWRRDPTFVLNDVRFTNARILVTGPNFGAGSSREHAVWGLQQYGFEAILAPSFADIFVANAFNVGLPAIVLDSSVCRTLLEQATAQPGTMANISLVESELRCGDMRVAFQIDERRRLALIEGRDEIQTTLNRVNEIRNHEAARSRLAPTTTPQQKVDSQ